MLVRGNGSQHNKVVKRCLVRLQPQLQSRLCELLPGPYNLLPFREMDCACNVVNIVQFVFQFIMLCGTARDAMLSTSTYIHYLLHMVLCTCPSQYEYCIILTMAYMKVLYVQMRIGSLGINKAMNALSNTICFSKPNNFLLLSVNY
jgi:hypothetical protein